MGWVLGGPIGVATIIVTFVVSALVDWLLPVSHRITGTTMDADDPMPMTATTIQLEGEVADLFAVGGDVGHRLDAQFKMHL